VYVHLSAKAIPEMTYTVLVGTLNPTHSLTYSHKITQMLMILMWNC